MSWVARILLSLMALLGAMALGLLGGLLGGLIPFAVSIALILSLAFLAVPWSKVIFSQEELFHDVRAFHDAVQTLEATRPKLKELENALNVDVSGPLTREQLALFADHFEALRGLPTEHLQALREGLFFMYRRVLGVQIILLVISALGGALLSFHFARWLR